ncbi:MAG: hypothetical protein ACK5WM_23905 [Rhodospirillales bacterium]
MKRGVQPFFDFRTRGQHDLLDQATDDLPGLVPIGPVFQRRFEFLDLAAIHLRQIRMQLDR